MTTRTCYKHQPAMLFFPEGSSCPLCEIQDIVGNLEDSVDLYVKEVHKMIEENARLVRELQSRQSAEFEPTAKAVDLMESRLYSDPKK